MDLNDIVDKLVAIESVLEVDVSGVGVSKIKNAWPWMPPTTAALQVPCFMHSWNMTAPLPLASQGPNGFRTQFYTLRISVYVGAMPGATDKISRVATALHHAFIDALARNLVLGGLGVQLLSLDGAGEETLSLLQWAKKPYVGLEYLMQVRIDDVITVGPGA